MGRTATTSPNVGEVTTASMAAYWTALSRLLAVRLRLTVRVPPSRRTRVSRASSWRLPGPMMVLRPAVPNAPGAGAANAAVLK